MAHRAAPAAAHTAELPDPLHAARASCTPKGGCLIGGTRRVIVAEGSRTSYDVWLDRHTGEGQLRRWPW